jgi:type I restriction enzyme S subunit
MKLETFFEKFDQFADAPDAVAKMRELVLELAVQGKLVERKDSDGNAAKIFSDGPPPEAASRYEVPETWIWIRFAAVGEQRLGKMLDQKGNRGELKPYLRNTNVQWMRFQLDDIKELRLESDELEEYRLLPDDLLICEGGEPGRCAIWGDPNREMYFQKAIHRVRPRKGILSEYLAICLQVDAQNGVLAKHFTGATIKHFTGRSLSEYSLPLPPLAEQKRIVAKVDELMALCDRLEAQQQERETRHAALARASLARFADAPTPANLPFLFHPSYAIPPADLRKSILTLAVQGKLVPQDPNDEPAEELLKRVASALPDKKSENPFLGAIEPSITDESEYELPLGWAWLPLGHVGIWATGCGFPIQYQGETDGQFLFCKVSDMNLPGNEVEIHTTIHKIDADVMKKIRARANPVGTVIFPKIGGAIATHKRRLVIKPTIIDNNCSGIQPIGLTDDSWLLLFLRNLDLTKYQSGTSVPAVSQGSLDPIRIGLPPLAEQRRIVAKVEQLMALVDALETQLAASRATAANLLSALVAELTVGEGAFSHRPVRPPPARPGLPGVVK